MPASDSTAREPARPAPPGSRRGGGAQRWPAPSYLSSVPSYTAEGVGGRRRGLPVRWANSLARWPPLFLSGSAPRPSSSCTSGVCRGLKRHYACDGRSANHPEMGGVASASRSCRRCWREAGWCYNVQPANQEVCLWERSLYSLGDWP